VIVTSPETQNVTVGENFTLTCNATGYPVPSIQWTLNGTSYNIRDPSVTTVMETPMLRSLTSIIMVNNATVNDTGVYQCMATNVVGNNTQNATATVQS